MRLRHSLHLESHRLLSSQLPKFVYGVRFRDAGSNYVYERTGALAGISPSVHPGDAALPIQAEMKRCVLKSDGTVNYYLDPDNSMWIQDTESDVISVAKITDPPDKTDILIKIGEGHDVSNHNIGKVIELSDGKGTRDWYASIIDINKISNTYICSNPLIVGWGTDANGNDCTEARIGTAKLDGSDGQVMVEIPAFWHKHSLEIDAAGIWQRHDIGPKKFPGARYIPKQYVGAFEGCKANAKGLAVDGWMGTWDAEAQIWDGLSYAALGSLFISAAGIYPASYMYRSEVRSRAAAVGDSFHQMGFFNNLAIQILMMVEFAKFNMQTGTLKIGAGISSFTGSGLDWSAYNGTRPIRRTGDTIRSGNHTWDMSTLAELAMMNANKNATYTIQSISYRGIENPYGHIWKWVDGINLQWQEPDENAAFMIPFVSDNPDIFADTLPVGHAFVQLPDRMVSHLLEGDPPAWINKNRYWKDPSPHLLPTEVSPTASGYIGDYSYFPTSPASSGSRQVLAVGGYANRGAYDGPFCVSAAYGSGDRSAYVGGRLCSKFFDK